MSTDRPQGDPQAPRAGRPRRFRVALYSHDSYGLGHLRRSLLLANALAASHLDVEVLIISGSSRAYFFETPEDVRVIRIPSVTKDESGKYISKDAGVPLADTVRERKRSIRKAVLSFRPDVLVVDHTPTGLRGELLPLLADLRHRTDTELVLGLRDILDEPSKVRTDWQRQGIYHLLESTYHHVWVYGCQEVFCLQELYDIPGEIGRQLRYLGYLGRSSSGAPSRPASKDEKTPGARAEAPSGGSDPAGGPAGGHAIKLSAAFPNPERPHVLCLVGGGGDGYPLARAFAKMLAHGELAVNGTIVTGPFLSHNKRRTLAALCAENRHVQLLRFTTHMDQLIQESDAVITMGGYNSLMETLSYGRKTLVVPRIHPRREQWLRAHAFQRHRLVEVLDPDQLDLDQLTSSLSTLTSSNGLRSPSGAGLSFDGVANFVRRIGEVLARRSVRESGMPHVDQQLLRA